MNDISKIVLIFFFLIFFWQNLFAQQSDSKILFFLQCGVYNDPNNAKGRIDTIERAGFKHRFIEGKDGTHILLVGGKESLDEIEKMSMKLQIKGTFLVSTVRDRKVNLTPELIEYYNAKRTLPNKRMTDPLNDEFVTESNFFQTKNNFVEPGFEDKTLYYIRSMASTLPKKKSEIFELVRGERNDIIVKYHSNKYHYLYKPNESKEELERFIQENNLPSNIVETYNGEIVGDSKVENSQNFSENPDEVKASPEEMEDNRPVEERLLSAQNEVRVGYDPNVPIRNTAIPKVDFSDSLNMTYYVQIGIFSQQKKLEDLEKIINTKDYQFFEYQKDSSFIYVAGKSISYYDMDSLKRDIRLFENVKNPFVVVTYKGRLMTPDNISNNQKTTVSPTEKQELPSPFSLPFEMYLSAGLGFSWNVPTGFLNVSNLQQSYWPGINFGTRIKAHDGTFFSLDYRFYNSGLPPFNFILPNKARHINVSQIVFGIEYLPKALAVSDELQFGFGGGVGYISGSSNFLYKSKNTIKQAIYNGVIMDIGSHFQWAFSKRIVLDIRLGYYAYLNPSVSTISTEGLSFSSKIYLKLGKKKITQKIQQKVSNNIEKKPTIPKTPTLDTEILPLSVPQDDPTLDLEYLETEANFNSDDIPLSDPYTDPNLEIEDFSTVPNKNN